MVVEGDEKLFNQYGVMLVNPAKHPHVKKEPGQAFVDWVISPEGQQTIAAYTIGPDQLFFPNAKRCGLVIRVLLMPARIKRVVRYCLGLAEQVCRTFCV